jgi:hypothetical protein
MASARRVEWGEVEKHHDQAPPRRPVISAEQRAGEHRSPDQPLNLGGRADNQRQSKHEHDNSRQFDREPMGRRPSEVKRLRVEEDLQEEADGDQGRRHDERPDNDLDGERQPPQRCAKPRMGRRRETDLHDKDGQSETRAMDSAEKKVPERPFVCRVENGAISDANDTSCDDE